MSTFPSRVVEMAACRQAFTLLGAGLLLLCTQASCDKTPPTASQPTSPASVLGQTIQFTPDSERYRVSGWNKSEGASAWSEGTSARLALPVPADAGPLTLKMTLRGLVQPPTLPFQPVEVYANDQKIADWQVSDTAVFTAEIPAELVKSGGETLNLQLRIPKAASPKSLGINTDGRILGVSCSSVELSGAKAN